MSKIIIDIVLNALHFYKLFSDDKFALTKDLEIRLDIKPRSTDGILISMRTTSKNYFTLEMKNGTVSCSVDVGKGPIYTSSTRSSPYYLCDGAWHTVKGQFIIYKSH